MRALIRVALALALLSASAPVAHARDWDSGWWDQPENLLHTTEPLPGGAWISARFQALNNFYVGFRTSRSIRDASAAVCASSIYEDGILRSGGGGSSQSHPNDDWNSPKTFVYGSQEGKAFVEQGDRTPPAYPRFDGPCLMGQYGVEWGDDVADWQDIVITAFAATRGGWHDWTRFELMGDPGVRLISVSTGVGTTLLTQEDVDSDLKVRAGSGHKVTVDGTPVYAGYRNEETIATDVEVDVPVDHGLAYFLDLGPHLVMSSVTSAPTAAPSGIAMVTVPSGDVRIWPWGWGLGYEAVPGPYRFDVESAMTGTAAYASGAIAHAGSTNDWIISYADVVPPPLEPNI